MLTSLAPSPIERVTLLGNLFLIMLTMSAFCFGDTLHASTTSELSEASRNASLKSSYLSMIVKDAPATTIACFLNLCPSRIFFLTYSILFKSSSWSDSYIIWRSIKLSNRPADTPIFIAVSILSPVRTHTLIPTSFMYLIVSATSSCNLSSMAVEPMSSRSPSINSSTAATFSSLSSISSPAYLFYSAQLL